MTNDIIFFTQLVSIVVFVFTVFGLYRLLVNQKDAVIQLQNEKVEYLKLQLEIAKSSSPDILVDRLSKRVDMLKNELVSLSSDHDTSKEALTQKEQEISRYEIEMHKLNQQIIQAKELLEGFTCPYCESPMAEHTFNSEQVGHLDVDHEYIAYECGLTIVDNYEKSPCKHINMGL